MASTSSLGSGLARRSGLLIGEPALRCSAYISRHCLQSASKRLSGGRLATGSHHFYSQHSQQRPRPSSSPQSRMAGKSKIEWYYIPVGVGIGNLGLVWGYKVYTREQERQQQQQEDGPNAEGQRRPTKRPRGRPGGPWWQQAGSSHVHAAPEGIVEIMGRFNEMDIPYYLRVPGFRLYAFVFGVNLDEVANPDLPRTRIFRHADLRSSWSQMSHTLSLRVFPAPCLRRDKRAKLRAMAGAKPSPKLGYLKIPWINSPTTSLPTRVQR